MSMCPVPVLWKSDCVLLYSVPFATIVFNMPVFNNSTVLASAANVQEPIGNWFYWREIAHFFVYVSLSLIPSKDQKPTNTSKKLAKKQRAKARKCAFQDSESQDSSDSQSSCNKCYRTSLICEEAKRMLKDKERSIGNLEKKMLKTEKKLSETEKELKKSRDVQKDQEKKLKEKEEEIRVLKERMEEMKKMKEQVAVVIPEEVLEKIPVELSEENKNELAELEEKLEQLTAQDTLGKATDRVNRLISIFKTEKVRDYAAEELKSFKEKFDLYLEALMTKIVNLRNNVSTDLSPLPEFPTLSYIFFIELKKAEAVLAWELELEQECSICQYKMDKDNEEELWKCPKCKTIGHSDCVDTWFTKNKSCPWCRDQWH